MLILTRRISEELIINDDVTITPVGVKGNQVRISIDAPGNVVVLREEMVERLNASGGLKAFIASKTSATQSSGALILTRRVGEILKFSFDGELLVDLAVLGVKGNQVRMGVDAPKNMPVHRAEIQQRIDNEAGDFNRKPRPGRVVNGNR